MEIRKYRPEDWFAIEQIHDLARMDELRAASLEAAFLPLCVAAERENLFGYCICVAEEKGQILGFVAFSQQELAWVYVHPAHYRRRIGTALCQAALAQMGPGEITVEVLVGNEAARLLYQSVGFGNEKVVSGRMTGNEDFPASAYVMTLGTEEDK